jgi:CelD/BcsL family acetyltransferase involved in cellulose biosynthesis
LRACGTSWASLADRAQARPFQDPAWCTTWLATRGAADGYHPFVAVLRDGERLLGVLPLARRRYRGIRLLEWVGAGTIDYGDALLDPSLDRLPALQALWTAVGQRGGVDIVRLGQVRQDAVCVGLLEQLGARPETEDQSYGIPIIWPSSQAWLGSLRKPSRGAISRGLRRLGTAGITFRVGEAAGTAAALVDTVLRQKRAWHAATGKDGLVVKPRGAEFLGTLAEAMAGRGQLHLSALRSEGSIVACHLGFLRAGVLYYGVPTYDRAWAKEGPGHLLLCSLLMWCCDNGLRHLDLLLGPEPYKLRFCPTVETVNSFAIPASRLGRAAIAAYRAARLLANSRKSSMVTQEA